MFRKRFNIYSRCLFYQKLPTNFYSLRQYTTIRTNKQSRKNHYEVLGLNREATSSQIRAAFVKLSKETHPDKNPDDPKNHSKFVRVNEAYSVLIKPITRREYDVSLAHWLNQQQTLARNGYSNHSPGFSSSPGHGSRPDDFNSEYQSRVFWDETIWHMRDRRKDANAFYPEDSYYGIRGIKRQSNGLIAAGCLVFVFLGFVYFYVAFKYTSRKQIERYKKVDRVNLKLLKEAQELARKNGISRQLEIMLEKQADKENNRKNS